MDAKTTRRDNLAAISACILFFVGLVAAKLLGWLDAAWWIVLTAPFVVVAAEVAFLLPPMVVGAARYYFRTR